MFQHKYQNMCVQCAHVQHKIFVVLKFNFILWSTLLRFLILQLQYFFYIKIKVQIDIKCKLIYRLNFNMNYNEYVLYLNCIQSDVCLM